MRHGQGHGHVEVVNPRRERGPKDRHREPRIGGTENGVDGILADHRFDRRLIRRVERHSNEPIIAGLRGCPLSPGPLVVSENDVRQERAAGRDAGRGRADPARTEHE